ncbi:MAG: hypothetical protein K5756_09790 [Clostridiales bacterium]|nr:hypothetical protein [Clostridiales bacterium]
MNSWVLIALIYDALAFLPQSIFGIINDRFPKIKFGIIGLIMIGISLFIKQNWIFITMIALGNAVVHISGAEATLRSASDKIGPAGVFVGGGSFGVILGQILALNNFSFAKYFVLILLLLALVSDIIIQIKNDYQFHATDFSYASPASFKVIIIMMFVTVAVRAYVGYSIPMRWNDTTKE